MITGQGPGVTVRPLDRRPQARAPYCEIVGGAIATALSAVLGVGLGAVVRNQVGAIVAALGALYALEPLLSVIPGIGSTVQRFGFGGLTSAVSGTAGFPTSAQPSRPNPRRPDTWGLHAGCRNRRGDAISHTRCRGVTPPSNVMDQWPLPDR